MGRARWIMAALAAGGIAAASIAASAAPQGPEWPGTYVYYDDAGNVVGEANNVLCKPQQAWGEVTASYSYRLGCGFSQ